MPSFENKKQLKFVITLATGKFGSSDNNVITLQGFRSSVDIEKAGGVQMSTLRAKVYGVKQDDMNAITTLQLKIDRNLFNTIDVYAIDGPVETLVFSGNIVNAWGDYQGIPDVHLYIEAGAVYRGQLKPVPPRSFKGGVDVASVMALIARDLGRTFENNGVQTQLSNLYLANTNLEQAKELAKAAGCWLYIDDKILAITPPNVPRKSLIPLISANTGLVGYPTFDSIGVGFRTLFNPAITFGGSVKIETDIKRAEGEWIVVALSHQLEAEKPGGAWFTNVRGNSNGLAVLGR